MNLKTIHEINLFMVESLFCRNYISFEIRMKMEIIKLSFFSDRRIYVKEMLIILWDVFGKCNVEWL